MIRIREMTDADAVSVARLHAMSWRSAYKDVLREDFLDGPVFAERLQSWLDVFSRPSTDAVALVAERDSLPLGFLYALVNHHPHWGTCLDSIHVHPNSYRRGVGTQLMLALSERLCTTDQRGLYLWVIKENQRAWRFYERLGAKRVELVEHCVPGAERVAEWRCHWEAAGQLREAAVQCGTVFMV